MRKALVVDDEKFITDTLSERLAKALNVSVSVAHSGREAMEALAESHFDILVTDYHMPEGNGADVLKFLSENKCKTYSVLFTGDVAPRLSETNEFFLGTVEKFQVEKLVQTILFGICFHNFPAALRPQPGRPIC